MRSVYLCNCCVIRYDYCIMNMLLCPHVIISEYNQTYHTSPSGYYVLDLLCVNNLNQSIFTHVSNFDVKKTDLN